MGIERIQYSNEVEKANIINEKKNSGSILHGESNLLEGNFLLFGEPEPQPPTDIQKLQKENNLMKAQISASDERADFLEELIVELAMMMYP